jgi:hypothetical protein
MMPVACDVHKFRFWPTTEKSGANIYTRCIVASRPEVVRQVILHSFTKLFEQG